MAEKETTTGKNDLPGHQGRAGRNIINMQIPPHTPVSKFGGKRTRKAAWGLRRVW